MLPVSPQDSLDFVIGQRQVAVQLKDIFMHSMQLYSTPPTPHYCTPHSSSTVYNVSLFGREGGMERVLPLRAIQRQRDRERRRETDG